ncbi:unnamed protein product [Psylliodes chrysocephalus]|uniref:Uncharacterized protein n=1 Tax=Psylliodes chrysocephalus TaxID=3402493 RepID=A0A9P0D464_9CUCU|nr:unnamed protein product [Psylliodes chrysocephala]
MKWEKRKYVDDVQNAIRNMEEIWKKGKGRPKVAKAFKQHNKSVPVIQKEKSRLSVSTKAKSRLTVELQFIKKQKKLDEEELRIINNRKRELLIKEAEIQNLILEEQDSDDELPASERLYDPLGNDTDKLQFVTLMDTSKFSVHSESFPIETLNNLIQMYPSKLNDLQRTSEMPNFINKNTRGQRDEDHMRTAVRKVLDNELTIREAAKDMVFPKVRLLINEDFNLHFRYPVTDTCKRCDSYNMKIKNSNGVEKSTREREKELHLRMATKDKDTTTTIAFDLMKTLATPNISMGVAYYTRQLWTYCLGIQNLTTDQAHMYAWPHGVCKRLALALCTI